MPRRRIIPDGTIRQSAWRHRQRRAGLWPYCVWLRRDLVERCRRPGETVKQLVARALTALDTQSVVTSNHERASISDGTSNNADG
jgi:hypothetical protein